VVAVYGHQTVAVFERYGAVTFIAFCVLLFLFLAPQFDLSAGGSAGGVSRLSNWVLGASLFFALVASWFGFAADYSRYLPAIVPARAVVANAGGGIFLATAAIGIFGVLIFTIDPTLNPDNFISYGVIGGALAFYAQFNANFFTDYENFLLITYIWAPAWAAGVLADYFLLHHAPDPPQLVRPDGKYARNGGVRWPALAAWLLGTLAAIPFINSTLWQSPPATDLLKGADLSGFIGFLVGGLVYLALSRRPRASTTEASTRGSTA
jgi:NCS1 family nucleobase:cation symporter-1